ncbi:MAG: PQQ-binding-like beta-propeller repeat protein, partial [Acidobacteria bacterium]|nr:PQQ-binding-like beta-propeller repeat protein [Acidobacteriota bacterium]
MKRLFHITVAIFLAAAGAAHGQRTSESGAHWPQWRGPSHTGVARGDAPVKWDDSTNVRWKIEIPGRGFSTPVIWGDRIFLTTAVPTGKGSAPAPAEGGSGRGAGGGAAVGEEQRFEVMAIDRRSGKVVWQRTATTAVPHEGYH